MISNKKHIEKLKIWDGKKITLGLNEMTEKAFGDDVKEKVKYSRAVFFTLMFIVMIMTSTTSEWLPLINFGGGSFYYMLILLIIFNSPLIYFFKSLISMYERIKELAHKYNRPDLIEKTGGGWFVAGGWVFLVLFFAILFLWKALTYRHKMFQVYNALVDIHNSSL